MLFEAGYKTQIQDEEKKRAVLLDDNWIYAVDSNFEHVNILKKDLTKYFLMNYAPSEDHEREEAW